MRSVVSPPSTIGVEEESLLLDPETRAPGSPAQAPWCVARARWKLFGPTGETLRRIRFHQRRTAFSFGHDWPKSSACSSNTCSAPSAARRASSRPCCSARGVAARTGARPLSVTRGSARRTCAPSRSPRRGRGRRPRASRPRKALHRAASEARCAPGPLVAGARLPVRATRLRPGGRRGEGRRARLPRAASPPLS